MDKFISTVGTGRGTSPTGRIDGSFDSVSRSLNHMFNFGGGHGKNKVLLLDPGTGQPEA